MSEFITNMQDLCDYFTVETPGQLNHSIYENTHCGASISVYLKNGDAFHNGDETFQDLTTEDELDGFTIQTIVEGSDATVDSEYFSVPIDTDKIDKWLEFMEAEADFLWKEAHQDEIDELDPIEQWLKDQDLECDGYSHGTWQCGIGPDGYYVDHAIGNDGMVVLRSTINVDSRDHYIEDRHRVMVPLAQALHEALIIVKEIRDDIFLWEPEEHIDHEAENEEEAATQYDNLDDWITQLKMDIANANDSIDPDDLQEDEGFVYVIETALEGGESKFAHYLTDVEAMQMAEYLKGICREETEKDGVSRTVAYHGGMTWDEYQRLTH